MIIKIVIAKTEFTIIAIVINSIVKTNGKDIDIIIIDKIIVKEIININS